MLFGNNKTSYSENEYAIFITTCPNKEEAKQIAGILIEKNLAACIQMFPIESVYVWQDKICENNEITLFIKSKSILFYQVWDEIKKIHSYEVPEIIQVPITDGLPEYLNWIDDCIKNKNISK